jgi:hypothetical protein
MDFTYRNPNPIRYFHKLQPVDKSISHPSSASSVLLGELAAVPAPDLND